jgi:hypothetical protein
MTRKARRKHLSQELSARRVLSPWANLGALGTLGALTAAATLGGPRPAAAAAVHDVRTDPRLSVIHDALQGPSRTRLATIRRSAADAAQERSAALVTKTFDVPSGP